MPNTLQPMRWKLCSVMAAVFLVMLLAGCTDQPDTPVALNRKSHATNRSVTRKPGSSVGSRSKAGRADGDRSRRHPDRGRVYRSRVSQSDAGPHDWGYRPVHAVRRVTQIVQDSMGLAPTTVVWLFDTSPSAMQWATGIHAEVRRWYAEDVSRWTAARRHTLQTGVITFGASANESLQAEEDPDEVVRALDAIRLDSSGREVTFQAVQLALDHHVPARVQQHREVLLVLITDEMGDDWQQVDKVVQRPRKFALPIYVIGVHAPFGRTTALSPEIESDGKQIKKNGWQPILQGPESRHLQQIALPIGGYDHDLALIDAGFGPFALEWLCRASGGALLAVRSYGSDSLLAGARRLAWPTIGTLDFDPDVMRRYQPEYIDEAAYHQLLTSNKACMALHQACLLPAPRTLGNPNCDFVKRSEPQLKKLLDRSQRVAAKVAPSVNELFEVLREGAVDRDKLDRPRWQAAYDLAFGRACATKARVDGYNAMLAFLKRGRSFQNSDSRRWNLEPAESTDLTSALRNLAKRAQTHLRRVTKDHPNTPWAKIAEYELKQPMGWRWSESD